MNNVRYLDFIEVADLREFDFVVHRNTGKRNVSVVCTNPLCTSRHTGIVELSDEVGQHVLKVKSTVVPGKDIEENLP